MEYAARKIKGTDKYHFTVKSSTGIKAVGYCATKYTCPQCNGGSKGETEIVCSVCRNEGTVPQVINCLGHSTPEEALQHYQEYLLDRAWYKGNIEPGGPCEICQATTNRLVTAGEGRNEFHILCDIHNTREFLVKVLGKRDVRLLQNNC